MNYGVCDWRTVKRLRDVMEQMWRNRSFQGNWAGTCEKLSFTFQLFQPAESICDGLKKFELFPPLCFRYKQFNGAFETYSTFFSFQLLYCGRPSISKMGQLLFCCFSFYRGCDKFILSTCLLEVWEKIYKKILVKKKYLYIPAASDGVAIYYQFVI